MVGAFGVGKTSLVRRFVESIFDESYKSSVGAKVDRKDVMAGDTAVTLMLWDLAGEDDLAPLSITHMSGAAGYILVADGTRAGTLAKAIELQERITGRMGALPFALALNKADLGEQWEVRSADVDGRAWTVFETSAKTGAGVEEMFHWMAVKLSQRNAAA